MAVTYVRVYVEVLSDGGHSIDAAAIALCNLSHNLQVWVQCDFEGVPLRAGPISRSEDVIDEYQRAIKARTLTAQQR